MKSKAELRPELVNELKWQLITLLNFSDSVVKLEFPDGETIAVNRDSNGLPIRIDPSFFFNVGICHRSDFVSECSNCCTNLVGLILDKRFEKGKYNVRVFPIILETTLIPISMIEFGCHGACSLLNQDGTCILVSTPYYRVELPLICAITPDWLIRRRKKARILGRQLCKEMTRVKYNETMQEQDCHILSRLQQFLEDLGLEAQELQKIREIISNRKR